jgi:L-lactate dehydrogenase complex protein LldG
MNEVLIQTFLAELERIGSKGKVLTTAEEWVGWVQEEIGEPKDALAVWQEKPWVHTLGLYSLLTRGLPSLRLFPLAAPSREEMINCRETVFRAKIGITAFDLALAGTGSLVLFSSQPWERWGSLIPPIHLALVQARDILPDQAGLWRMLEEKGFTQTCGHGLTLITGSSRTADIELKLVKGVHGPGTVSVGIWAGSEESIASKALS